MRSLLLFALVGAGAQLVDGALGMAFGVTASTLLVLSGIGAARASAAVHLLANLPVVVGLAVGGILVAPFAAWLVSRVSPALLGARRLAASSPLTNSQKLVDYFGVEWPWSTGIYVAIVVAWAALVAYAWRASRAKQFVPDAVEPEVAAAR